MNNQALDKNTIIELLRDLDAKVETPCRIVICGGAAAIVGYGLNRTTGDIDILEPQPKDIKFQNIVLGLLKEKGYDESTINEAVKGFVDNMSPKFLDRVVHIEGFKNIDVAILGKADLLTMKICSWRERDIEDIRRIGIIEDDIVIIKENIEYLSTRNPTRAYKAELSLHELDISLGNSLKAEDVKTLAEVLEYYHHVNGKEASMNDLKVWQKDMEDGHSPVMIAKVIENQAKEKMKELGMSL